MATTATQRPSANPPPPPLPKTTSDELKNWSRKKLSTLAFSFPFDMPSSAESGAIRIVRNLESFALYYATFVWTVLFIVLVPDRMEAVIFLVATTDVAFIYSLLLRACPDSFLLNSVIDKRFVFFVTSVVGAIGMIASGAQGHLFIVLVSTIPVVVLHAALSKREAAVGEADGEMARLVEEKLGGGCGGGAQPESLV